MRLQPGQATMSSYTVPEEMRAIIEEVMGKENTDIDLRGHQIGDAGAVFLGEKLRGNKIVEKLYLNGCGIGAVGARALAESLSGHNHSVKELWLYEGYDEGIGDDGAQALAQMLKKNSTLEKLFLSACGVGDRSHQNDGPTLPHHPQSGL